MVLANLFGAIVTFCDFRFIDPVGATTGPRPGAFELTYAIVGFTLIMVAGRAWTNRWLRPLREAPGADSALVRRRAVAVPFIVAAITMTGWVAAGVVWGILWPLTSGQFSLVGAGRVFFAIACVAGTLATAFIFFAVERRWRHVLPTFFPDGDISSVAGVIRLSVRARLLIIFFVVGVVPLSILGVFTYTRSLDLLDASPAEARQIVAWTVPVILFFVAAGVAAAVGLSILVAQSVAGPLGQLGLAMAEVGQGDLDRRAPVVANDEIGALSEGFNRMLQGLREREFVKETFGKYVTREIRDEILAGRVALGGQSLEVTILFSDLRDFTPWVEATPPADVVRELNAYFSEMETAIRGSPRSRGATSW